MTNAVNLASLAVSGALSADANGNVGIGTSSINVSGMEISRATGVSPTPVELRLTTTTNDSGWSTTNPWGRISFYSADASVGGAKVHASIQTTAQSSAGGNSNLDFFVTDTANGTLFRTLSFQGAGTNTTQTVFYSGGGNPSMTLGSNGRLGIGTTSPTNFLDVSGAIGKDYQSNVTVINNGSSYSVLNAFNGQHFSNWLLANFNAGGGRFNGFISIDWDVGNASSAAVFAFSKSAGFNGVNIVPLSVTNYNGSTGVSGNIIVMTNSGSGSITPVFKVIVTSCT